MESILTIFDKIGDIWAACILRVAGAIDASKMVIALSATFYFTQASFPNRIE